MEKINSGIIVSHNSNYAYKFRTKANSLGLKLGYKRTLQELIEYLMFEKEGIVFVDIKSRTYHKYLSLFTKFQNYKNFSIVFLNDNFEVSEECDNIFTFVSSFDDLEDTIAKINDQVLSRHNRIEGISPQYIDGYLQVILNDFCLSQKMTGFDYICDCVKVYLTSVDKQYIILKDVYKIIANRYQKTPSNIEKSIRSVISQAYHKNTLVFKNTFLDTKVTNTSFINFVVEKIKFVHSQK